MIPQIEEQIRYVCPECSPEREYKTKGWYKRHCLLVHSEFLEPIEREVIPLHTIDDIYNEISEIKIIIGEIRQMPGQMTHDIDITQLKAPPAAKIEANKFRTPEFIKGYTECIKELTDVLEERRKQLEEILGENDCNRR